MGFLVEETPKNDQNKLKLDEVARICNPRLRKMDLKFKVILDY